MSVLKRYLYQENNYYEFEFTVQSSTMKKRPNLLDFYKLWPLFYLCNKIRRHWIQYSNNVRAIVSSVVFIFYPTTTLIVTIYLHTLYQLYLRCITCVRIDVYNCPFRIRNIVYSKIHFFRAKYVFICLKALILFNNKIQKKILNSTLVGYFEIFKY